MTSRIRLATLHKQATPEGSQTMEAQLIKEVVTVTRNL